jgi:hypothetical protein
MNKVGRRIAPRFIQAPLRQFGGGHGHGEDHHHYESSRSQGVKYKIPTQHDGDHLVASRPIFTERLMQAISGWWAVDREQVLDNTTVNKYSAYHWFRTFPL